MSVCAFEMDKPLVTEAIRQGDFDHVEIVGTVEETKFFRMLLGEGVLERLAAAYPTPRQKEEVPLWLYLASELTLRLHGAMGFGGYPYILHCGGLVEALGPRQAVHLQDPQTGQWRRRMEGYNAKNAYERTTPCDKDFLRKLARDTDATLLEEWFGVSVAGEYKRMEAFDSQGIFIVDGTYIFVPLDNPNYENSSVLRFDESHHPIDKETFEAMPLKGQQRCRYRRCYRAVTLSHTTAASDYSLRCGVKVMAGKEAENPQAWPLVERFVRSVGQGVMKLLIFDRGFIDGQTVSRLKKELHVDSLFPLKKGMDLWEDAKVLAREDGRVWQRYDIPKPEPPAAVPERPQKVARREAQRQKSLREKKREQEQTEGPPPAARRLEWIRYKWVEPGTVWESCQAPVWVLLIENHYANGDTLEWALAGTRRFADPLEMWKRYRLRPNVEEDHRQEKCFWDMTAFRSTAFSMVVNRIVFVELAYSLIQIFLRQIGQNQIVGRSRQRLLDSLLPQESKVAVYYRQRFGMFATYEYQELLLTLCEGARRKALGKTRRLRRAQLTPPELPWRPDLDGAPQES